MDQKIILGLLWISAATVVAVDFDFEQHDNDNCESQQQHFFPLKPNLTTAPCPTLKKVRSLTVSLGSTICSVVLFS